MESGAKQLQKKSARIAWESGGRVVDKIRTESSGTEQNHPGLFMVANIQRG